MYANIRLREEPAKFFIQCDTSGAEPFFCITTQQGFYLSMTVPEFEAFISQGQQCLLDYDLSRTENNIDK